MSNPLKLVGFEQDVFVQSAVQMEELDTVRILKDGRMFAYALAGEALAAGKLTQGAVPDANCNNDAVYANAAIGDMEVQLTPGAAITENYYAGGWLHINAGAGVGHTYRVKSHPAFSATSFTVELLDPIRVALTSAASKFTMIANRQKSVLTSLVGVTAPYAGVPLIAVTSGYYFWNQVKGPAAVLGSGTLVVGNPVATLTTAGAVGPMPTNSILAIAGTVMAVNATTEYSLINLAIPGY